MRRFKVVAAMGQGDWRSKLLALAQLAIGLVALLAILAMTTREPLLLLGLAFVLPVLIPLGIVLFAVAAVFAQRSMVLERFDTGQTVVRQGDPGRQVYVIKSGTAEVVRREADGSEKALARLGPGAYFGEMALIGNAPRNATVRACEPLEVYRMRPDSFLALYTSLPELHEQVDKVVARRLDELSKPSG